MQTLELRQHLLGACRAVQAECAYAHALHHGKRRDHVRTGEDLAALIAGKGHKDGLFAHAADRQNRRTRIGQRHHRLNDVEVDARLLKARRLLGVNVDELFKRRVAEGG